MSKLVRDNIPSIIEKNDKVKPVFSTITDNEVYKKYLFKKLVEEAKEVQTAETKEAYIEELADIREVEETLLMLLEISENEIEKVRKEKKKRKGGFEKRILLKK